MNTTTSAGLVEGYGLSLNVEDGDTFEANAVKKARGRAGAGRDALADDSASA